MVKCPVCGYDTLTEEGGYEICYLCDWEDDPLARIEPPDRIVGGPNSDYSIMEARENFNKYLTMYRPTDNLFQSERNEKIICVKRKIIEAFNRLDSCISDEERKKMNVIIKKNREMLIKHF